jgi:hypothetical protein
MLLSVKLHVVLLLLLLPLLKSVSLMLLQAGKISSIPLHA